MIWPDFPGAFFEQSGQQTAKDLFLRVISFIVGGKLKFIEFIVFFSIF